MLPSELPVVAEGELPTGERWILKAGGTHTDYYTFLETVHPDGRRDEGGMGGPPLYPGAMMNTYTGGTEHGLRRVVVRADPRVARVRVLLASGEGVELPLLATQSEMGIAFFAALLPRSAELVSVTAIGPDGNALEPQDLSRSEAAWQRFLRRHREPPDATGL
jgi:hypothetical protein